MNLFYILGTNDYLVDSNLNITPSPITINQNEGVSFYPYLLAFKSTEGVSGVVLDTSSFTFNIIHDGLPLHNYSDFVLVNNTCNFIGTTYYGSTVLTTISIDNSSYEVFIINNNTTTWADITYGNGIYCIIGKSDTNEITVGTSTDKVTWNYTTLTTLNPVHAPKVSFGNNVFIIIDKSIYKSSTGISWTMVYDDPIYGWDDIQFSNKGFIAYNKNAFYSGISLDGDVWNTQYLPDIIGLDVTSTLWNDIASNGNILCMKSSPNINDITSGMSSITFSNDGGLSWMTQTLLDGANRGIVSLSVPKFWNQFINTTET